MFSPYQQLLTALAEELGLNAASLLATQEIVIDNLPIGLHLEEEGEQPEVLVCSLLGSINPDRLADVSRAMLLANHLWAGTGGATLGMIPDGDRVTLSALLPLHNLEAKKLGEKLAKIAQIGLAWQDFITSTQGTPTIPGAMYNMRA